MKSRTLFFAGVMCAVFSGSLWAFGIGAQFNADFSFSGAAAGFAPGWAVAISPRDKLHFTGYWNFAVNGGEYSIFGITADFWLLNPDLVPLGGAASLGIFAGPGLYASWNTSGPRGALDIGVRIPAGINIWFLSKTLELYIQAVPSWGIYLFPEPSFGNLSLPLNLGFRFWIR